MSHESVPLDTRTKVRLILQQAQFRAALQKVFIGVTFSSEDHPAAWVDPRSWILSRSFAVMTNEEEIVIILPQTQTTCDSCNHKWPVAPSLKESSVTLLTAESEHGELRRTWKSQNCNSQSPQRSWSVSRSRKHDQKTPSASVHNSSSVWIVPTHTQVCTSSVLERAVFSREWGSSLWALSWIHRGAESLWCRV